MSLKQLAILGLALLLFAAPLAGRAAPEPYEINVLLPLTGAVSFIGMPEEQTLRAVEAWANRTGGIGGRPVKFVVHDDQSNPQVDVQLATQVFTKNVPVMLGPTMTAQCNAVSPLVKEGPVIFCFTSGVHPPPGSFVFGFGASTDHVMAVSMRYLSMSGAKRIAVITPTDATGQDGDRMAEAAVAEDRSLTIVDREHFNPGDTTVAAQLSRIKATNPQALIAWTTGPPLATVLRGMQEAGLDILIVTTPGNITYEQMKQYAAFLPKGLIFPGPLFLATDQLSDRATKDAIKTFLSDLGALGVKPDQAHNSTYDAATLIIRALRKLGPTATAAQVRDYLATTKGWRGINGEYDFRGIPQRGLAKDAIIMVRWDPTKGTWVPISKPGGIPLAARLPLN